MGLVCTGPPHEGAVVWRIAFQQTAPYESRLPAAGLGRLLTRPRPGFSTPGVPVV